jgi:hypothetical protein
VVPPRSRATSRRILIGGSVAQRPGYGGHAWVFLQYLLGFRRLGYDVLFVDRLEPDMCVDEAGMPCRPETSVNLRYLAGVLKPFDLSFAVLVEEGTRVIGMSREELAAWADGSVLFLNVMGYIDDEEVLAGAECRVFLDIDPGFGQMWRALGLHDLFQGHDAYVTIGENIGRPGCTIPTCGVDWLTTRQPVVLDHWPAQLSEGSGFTSIASWRGPFGPVEYEGATYGLRVHEFRKLVDLPQRTGQRFEVAMEIDDADHEDLARLTRSGWRVADPRAVAHTPEAYQRFIQRSGAELMVAKNMYVRSRSGWFSDRSICYLASGKPVLAQDTGLERMYPTGEGLLTFSTLDEASEGVEEICADYRRHANAARRIAEEHFESDMVLSGLLEKLGAA